MFKIEKAKKRFKKRVFKSFVNIKSTLTIVSIAIFDRVYRNVYRVLRKKKHKYKFFIHWMINCVPIKRYPGLKFQNDAQDLKEYVEVMSSDNRSKDFFKSSCFSLRVNIF